VDLGLPELTDAQIETVSQAAEKAARKHVFSKISQKLVEKLDIIVEAEGAKPVSFTIEVDLTLLPEVKWINQKALADEAVREAFAAVEKNLRKLV